ncbi:hypothetical protein BDV25DRAFT_135139 [Aspergillus avenaceus]|uniref:Uncharacterized protein n=1 Tax=Aspergillus avenaceus TaxID=36643 RepID=A0A5N6U941_ASPAV|nr:hypothetical protein BDV25DRAFT_135139 [Aspergillus avenaceus]
MRSSAAILATAMTLTVAVHAGRPGNCPHGLNYCASALNYVGGNDDAIEDALREAGHPDIAVLPGLWYFWLFHCNPDESLRVIERCNNNCIGQGVGKSDICDTSPPLPF